MAEGWQLIKKAGPKPRWKTPTNWTSSTHRTRFRC